MFNVWEFPWPPSVNHLYKRSRNGVYLTPRARKFYDDTGWIMHNSPTYEGKVRLEIDLYPDNHKRYDGDNFVKSIQDALVRRGVIADDSQVWELIVRKHEPGTRQQGAIVTLTGGIASSGSDHPVRMAG